MKITPVLWTRPMSTGLYPIKIRVSENNKSQYHTTGLSIPKQHWNSKTKEVRKSLDGHIQMNKLIQDRVFTITMIETQKRGRLDIMTTHSTIKPLDRIENLGDLFNYQIKTFQSEGKIGSMKKYKTVLNHLNKCGLDVINLEEFNSTHRIHYNDFLTNVLRIEKQGVHTYNKVLKRMFTFSIDLGIRKSAHPYSGYRTPLPKSKTPRFLTNNQIYLLHERLIENKLDVNLESTSISMYLFSIYSYGMRFGDVIRLKWSDIKDNHLEYTMGKTGSFVRIPLSGEHYELLKLYLPTSTYPRVFQDGTYVGDTIERNSNNSKIIELEETFFSLRMKYFQRLNDLTPKPKTLEDIRNLELLTNEESLTLTKTLEERDIELKKLVTLHSRKSKDYIFPFLMSKGMSLEQEYSLISSKNALVNKKLREISIKMNISPFSFHSSRHTFSVSTYQSTGNVLEISRMLGHSSLDITAKYLQKFDTKKTEETQGQFISNIRQLYVVY
jgi:integrase